MSARMSQLAGTTRPERRLPGLDGLRGVAILLVLLYHGGVSWAPGGFLGVEIFFVLSGFLITSLIVDELSASGTVSLRNFWARRARRLLPALFVMVAVVGIYYWAAGASHAIPGVLGDGVAALFYYSNWHLVASGTSYFAQAGLTSPFEHTWSLAIEEQFYVVWPLLAVLAVRLVPSLRQQDSVGRRRAAVVLAVLAAASAVEMAVLYGNGSAAKEARVYFGTDTRAQGLLVGAALALAVGWGSRRSEGGASEAALDSPEAGLGSPSPVPAPTNARRDALAGGAVLAGFVALTILANGDDGWMYRGGFLLTDVLAAGAILLVTRSPGSLLPTVCSVAPLRLLGTISYGVYLWHFPLFLWLTPQSVGVAGPGLFAVRVGITLAVAGMSYVLIEEPIRRRRVGPRVRMALAPTGAVVAVVCLLAASSTAASAPIVARTSHSRAVSHDLIGSQDCTVSLHDTSAIGLAPLPLSALRLDEYLSLDREQVEWNGSASLRFRTCPPHRILLVGDSIAYTLGVGLLDGEQDYGVELGVAPLLGCAFGVRGELNVDGAWMPPPSSCRNELATWRDDERAFHPQAVVVELGFRDMFDWRWGSTNESLGDAGFDSYVAARVRLLIDTLASRSIPVLFLSVPVVSPPPAANGTALPQAAPARRIAMNRLIAQVAAGSGGRASLLDINPVIAPGGRYSPTIDGQVCRAADGIHFTPWCGSYLEPWIFRQARSVMTPSS